MEQNARGYKKGEVDNLYERKILLEENEASSAFWGNLAKPSLEGASRVLKYCAYVFYVQTQNA